MTDHDSKLSKFLSFVLRHKPGSIGLTLNEQGWASISELLLKARAAGNSFTRDDLIRVVETNDKRRFTFSPDGKSIRAAQGHSVEVALGLVAQIPPRILYHGTASRFVDSIFSEGLRPQSRQQVHLSVDEATAVRVGQRYGKPVALVVAAGEMHASGFEFFLAENGVWLTDQVPPKFLTPSSWGVDSPPQSNPEPL